MLYDSMIRLSERTEKALTALFERLLAGEITPDVFHVLAVALIGQGNAKAYALADLALAAYLERVTQTPTATLGLAPPRDDLDRIHTGLGTLLQAYAEREDIRERIERYGRSEPLSAFQDAYVRGMQERELGGYTRVLSPGACELCRWLYRDGYVWPADKPFHKHEGCGCYPQPVL